MKQRGFSLIELLVVIVVIAILAQVAMSRYFATKDRAHVTAAIADVDHFRRALAVYEIDYGLFPDNTYNSTAALSGALIDPSGNDYMNLPDGANFAVFAYEAQNAGEVYEIEVQALDHSHTTILASPDGTVIQ